MARRELQPTCQARLDARTTGRAAHAARSLRVGEQLLVEDEDDPMATRARRRIDINTASASEIEQACGIDGVLAQRIVRYRQEHGPFETREDIDQVPGFAEVRTDEVLSVVDLPSRGAKRRGSTGTAARGSERSDTVAPSRTSGRKGASSTKDNSAHGEPSRGSRTRAGTRARSAEPTTDHDFIRRWVEERGGWPACVRGTGNGQGDTGMIRIDFPGFSGKDSLERIEWDQWFQQFEDNNLAFLYRDMRHSDGDLDRFNKLVKRTAGRASKRTSRR
jgi:competence ComEA-like helix-hairpin-helix protein